MLPLDNFVPHTRATCLLFILLCPLRLSRPEATGVMNTRPQVVGTYQPAASRWVPMAWTVSPPLVRCDFEWFRRIRLPYGGWPWAYVLRRSGSEEGPQIEWRSLNRRNGLQQFHRSKAEKHGWRKPSRMDAAPVNSERWHRSLWTTALPSIQTTKAGRSYSLAYGAVSGPRHAWTHAAEESSRSTVACPTSSFRTSDDEFTLNVISPEPDASHTDGGLADTVGAETPYGDSEFDSLFDQCLWLPTSLLLPVDSTSELSGTTLLESTTLLSSGATDVSWRAKENEATGQIRLCNNRDAPRIRLRVRQPRITLSLKLSRQRDDRRLSKRAIHQARKKQRLEENILCVVARTTPDEESGDANRIEGTV